MVLYISDQIHGAVGGIAGEGSKLTPNKQHSSPIRIRLEVGHLSGLNVQIENTKDVGTNARHAHPTQS